MAVPKKVVAKKKPGRKPGATLNQLLAKQDETAEQLARLTGTLSSMVRATRDDVPSKPAYEPDAVQYPLLGGKAVAPEQPVGVYKLLETLSEYIASTEARMSNLNILIMHGNIPMPANGEACQTSIQSQGELKDRLRFGLGRLDSINKMIEDATLYLA